MACSVKRSRTEGAGKGQFVFTHSAIAQQHIRVPVFMVSGQGVVKVDDLYVCAPFFGRRAIHEPQPARLA